METPGYRPEQTLQADERIVVIGAGGFAAETLYLRNMAELGVPDEQLVLVDASQSHLEAAQAKRPAAAAYGDTGDALAAISEQGLSVPAIIIASSTAAHAANLRAIVRAAESGHLDLERTKIWSEKPLAPPAGFDQLYTELSARPGLDLSIGYILRVSPVLTALQQHLETNDDHVQHVQWLYGKDRRPIQRPTQGVFPDESVHPMSVTDLVLSRSRGEIAGVRVDSARLRYRPFVNEEIQMEARRANPDMPDRPSSDLIAKLWYVCHSAEGLVQVPASYHVSFLHDQEVRRMEVQTARHDSLTVDFDARQRQPDGTERRVDMLRDRSGEILFEWDGDKGAEQSWRFIGGAVLSGGHRPDVLVDLHGEARIQHILSQIGRLAHIPSAAEAPAPGTVTVELAGASVTMADLIQESQRQPIVVGQVDPTNIEQALLELKRTLEPVGLVEGPNLAQANFSGMLLPPPLKPEEEVNGYIITEGHGTLESVGARNWYRRTKHAGRHDISAGTIILLKGAPTIDEAVWLRFNSDEGDSLNGFYIESSSLRSLDEADTHSLLDMGARARRRLDERYATKADKLERVLARV